MSARRRPSLGALAWLVIGGLLLAFAQGRWAIPACAWLAPVLLVRFARTTSPVWALLGITAVHTAAWEVAYLGTVPLPAGARIGLFAGLSLVVGSIFLADRWASGRSDRLAATLVLPCGWVAFDFVNALFSPNGTWGSLAYTFSDQLPLAQIASITGWTGVTFLVIWLGPVVNAGWEHGFGPGSAGRRAATAFAGVLATVLLFGGARLALSPIPPQTLQAAAVVAPSTFEDETLEELWRYTRGVELDPAGVERARERITASLDEHFALVRREAEAGAELVVWAEANLTLTAREESAWLERARRLARELSIYLGMGASVFHPETRGRTENVLLLVRPDGEVAWRFLKATRVPGSGNARGDGILPRLDTEHGRLTAAICFDLDFPRLLRQAGRMEADLLLAPSNDWYEVREIHLRMHRLRAVEQGVHLFRPTKDGISAAVDRHGRLLARLDTEISPHKVMRVALPTAGGATLYSHIGDSFSWLATAGFFGLLLATRRRS